MRVRFIVLLLIGLAIPFGGYAQTTGLEAMQAKILSAWTVDSCQVAPLRAVRQRCSMMPRRRSRWTGLTPQPSSPSCARGSRR